MQELPFLHSACRLMLIDICIKFHEDSLRAFQVTERTPFVTDRRTDAWGKTICLSTLKGGDIIQTKRPNLRVFQQKDSNGIANSEDPDQTAHKGAV